MRRTALTACLLLAVTATAASGKGIEYAFTVDTPHPVAGEQIRITLRATSTTPGEKLPACPQTRVVAVAPGVPVRRALRSLEGGVVSRRIGRWDAFRLASLRQTGDHTWTARLRPGTAGTWTLIVPNYCAAGYVLPEGAARHEITVTSR
ncbi:MAG: hypothetical protein AB1416_03170 [Actinomycetota bacterium]